jgi:hypothetical protein
LFYQAAKTKDFPGMVAQMKAYLKSRGAWVDQNLLADDKIPATPVVTDASDKSHGADRALRFSASPYKGASPFAGVQWRLAEVTPIGGPVNSPHAPRLYEIIPTWESPALTENEPLTLPAGVTKAGRTYRVRVRMKDATGRWGHWSVPAEFIAS